MIKSFTNYIIIGFILLLFPFLVKAEQLNSIDIKGTLYDQRADYNIFFGIQTGNNNTNSTIVSNTLASDMTPVFQQYNFYSPLYVKKWFHDYGYNSLKNINNMCKSIIDNNNDIGINIKIWAYKSMYLSLKTASKVVPETQSYINNDLWKLSRNSDYLFSLIRMEDLLKQVIENLTLNSNYYKNIDGISDEHNKIFNSYILPALATSGNFKAINEIFPNSISIPTDENDLKDFYDSLINETTNKKMIDDNTTMYYLNIKKDYTITLNLNENGMYEYKSPSFFIADNFGIGEDLEPNKSTNHFWKNNEISHNYNFTYKMELDFKPKVGSEFAFEGDDDVWVYISEKENPSNNFKVIDLGGIHPSQTASFKFEENNKNLVCYVKERNATDYNNNFIANVSLNPNKVYTLYLFFSERKPTGSSFKIVTDIEIIQSTIPTFIDNENISFTSTNSNIITKKLSFIPEESSVFRLYQAETGNLTPENVTFEVVGDSIVFTFAEIPSKSVNYYLTIQHSNQKESNRVKLTVNPYVEKNEELKKEQNVEKTEETKKEEKTEITKNPKTSDGIIKNPKTSDGIIKILLLSSISIIGILKCRLFINKKIILNK